MSDEVMVTGTKLYKVIKNKPVYLSIIVGEGQVGGTALSWQNQIIQEENVDNYMIDAPGMNLKGKILRCATKVLDINPNTNKTSVTYQFKGGKKEEEFTFKADIQMDGMSALYAITFVFT